MYAKDYDAYDNDNVDAGDVHAGDDHAVDVALTCLYVVDAIARARRPVASDSDEIATGRARSPQT